MIVVGLTGSIGMGKSTAGDLLRTLGVPVHDADEEVHRLLSPGGAGATLVAQEFPYARYPGIYGRKNRDGIKPIDRRALGAVVFGDAAARARLESILHPLVRAAQAEFIRKHKALGDKIAVLDIPLLFETGGELRVDHTITVTAPFFMQKMRVMARAGMNEEKFHAILGRQLPDREKRARADFVVQTGLGRAHTLRQLKAVLKKIKSRHDE